MRIDNNLEHLLILREAKLNTIILQHYSSSKAELFQKQQKLDFLTKLHQINLFSILHVRYQEKRCVLYSQQWNSTSSSILVLTQPMLQEQVLCSRGLAS